MNKDTQNTIAIINALSAPIIILICVIVAIFSLSEQNRASILAAALAYGATTSQSVPYLRREIGAVYSTSTQQENTVIRQEVPEDSRGSGRAIESSSESDPSL